MFGPDPEVCIQLTFPQHKHLSDFYVEVNKFAADQLFMSSWATAPHTHTHNKHTF